MRRLQLFASALILSLITGGVRADDEEIRRDPSKILVVVDRSGRVPDSARISLRKVMNHPVTSKQAEQLGGFEPVLNPNRIRPIYGSSEEEMKTEAAAENTGAILLLYLQDRTIDRVKKSLRTVVKLSLYVDKKGRYKKIHSDTIRATGYGLHAGAASDMADIRIKTEKILADELMPALFSFVVKEDVEEENGDTTLYAEITNNAPKPIRKICVTVPYGKGSSTRVWSEEEVPAGETKTVRVVVDKAYKKVRENRAELAAVLFGREGGKREERRRRPWRRR